MTDLAATIARRRAEVLTLSGALGRAVDLAELGILDRSEHLSLGPAIRPVSPNGACRMIRTADGWLAINLARPEDVELVPAFVGAGVGADPWAAIEGHAAGQPAEALLQTALLLGLPACRVGERAGDRLRNFQPWGPRAVKPVDALEVLDLSALWAGPLCGAVLAAAGAQVTKVESRTRPDPTRFTAAAFSERLNGGKTLLTLDLGTQAGSEALLARIATADVLITAARPRGLRSIGLDPEVLRAERADLIWVAITGHGLEQPDRVAFGDDAAAAGGLTGDGAAPVFLGDALADPLAGLAAAVGALSAVARNSGGVIDVAMAAAAAEAAVERLGCAA